MNLLEVWRRVIEKFSVFYYCVYWVNIPAVFVRVIRDRMSKTHHFAPLQINPWMRQRFWYYMIDIYMSRGTRACVYISFLVKNFSTTWQNSTTQYHHGRYVLRAEGGISSKHITRIDTVKRERGSLVRTFQFKQTQT